MVNSEHWAVGEVQSALRPKDRTEIGALVARVRAASKPKPLLLTGQNAKAAAQAMVQELDRGMYRVDLSAVVSKYIGETEKNLSRVFDQAEGGLLLFDEADALFGKRTGVKDSHDRYATIEIGYLLQRAEAHPGIVILVSGSQRPLPAAVRRRLSISRFPPPPRRRV